jgi:GIY-YIG catalytic domain
MIGRLYAIQSTEDDSFYIGSTRQTLQMRLKNHRSKSKDPLRQKTPLYVYFNRVGWSRARIILLAEFEDISDSELRALETSEIENVIKNSNCLNKAVPIQTIEYKKQADKEYGKVRRQEKKEEERERVKQWRIANPEKYAEQCRRYREKARLKKNLPE